MLGSRTVVVAEQWCPWLLMAGRGVHPDVVGLFVVRIVGVEWVQEWVYWRI